MTNLILSVALLVTTLSCGKTKDKNYAKVTMAFGNDSTALAEVRPSTFAVKMKYVLMTPERDGNPTAENNYSGTNRGQSAILWGNAKCTVYNKDEETESFTMHVKSDANCEEAGVDYFDLNRAAADVNADLNSQAARIPPGSYKYLQLALVGEEAGGNNSYQNTKWGFGVSAVADRTFAATQTEWVAKIEPPLELAQEETVQLTLTYSLDQVVSTGLVKGAVKVKGVGASQPGAYDDCNDEKTVCLKFPKLSIAVKK